MAQVIKVTCNGPQQHVNEVDLDAALEPTIVLRTSPSVSSVAAVPERLVLKCRFCTEGRIVLTRRMMDELRRRQGHG